MTTRKVTFTLPNYIVKNATGGLLLGDFNNWNTERGIELERNEKGDLAVTIELISGESYQYRYLLNDGRWVNDDRANSYETGPTMDVENCVIFVSASAEYEAEHKEKAEEQKKVPAKKSAKKPAQSVSSKNKILTGKVDLTKVDGVTKDIASLLQQKGIETFATLAKTTIKSLTEMLEDGGDKFNKVNPTAWPKLAKTLAAKRAPQLTKDDKEKSARVKATSSQKNIK